VDGGGRPALTPPAASGAAGGDRGGSIRIGLGVGLALWIGTVLYRPRLLGQLDLLLDLTLVAAGAAALFAAGIVLGRRRGIAWLVLALTVLAGVGLRLWLRNPEHSDVLDVTQAAIARWLSGADPYGVGYAVAIPPGSPFPYGPVALAWYAPFGSSAGALEVVAGIVVLVALALHGRPVGLAVYALSPLVVTAASDGSNNTTAGLLLLAALLCLPRYRLLGGLMLAVATGFKLFAAAWLPPALIVGGWRVLAGFGLGTAVAWGPAVLAWGAAPIVDSLRRALAIQPEPSYSLGALVQAVTGRAVSREAFLQVRLVAGAATAVVVSALVWFRRFDLTLAGLAIFLVTLYAGYWSTHEYLVMAAPAVCWELDRWLGTARWGVRWPWFAATGRPAR
jgi:hypothetical protein